MLRSDHRDLVNENIYSGLVSGGMWANTTAVRCSNYGDCASSDLVNWGVLASWSPDNCLLFVFNVIQLPAVSTEALLKYHRNES